MGHHRLLGTTDDPDRHVHSAENKCEALRFFLFLIGVRTFHRFAAKALPFIGGRRECSAQGASKPRGGADYWRAHFQVPLVQLAIFACVCATMPWWYYPLFWLLPIYVLVFVPDEIRGFTEHAHPVLPDSAMDDQRLITVLPGPIEAMFFSPRNMNYHCEHHLWPYIPYYNLPGVHQLIRKHPLNTTLVRGSYVAFLWRWFCELPLRSRADKSSQAATADLSA